MPGVMESIKAYWLWTAIAGLGGLLLFALPGGYDETSRSLLHGLCAQTPSHSYMFGDQRLPFDARMTGIYAGSLAAVVPLLILRRPLVHGDPSRRIVVGIIVLVVAMAVDGFNSLFIDLGLWHPYASRNGLRVVTGFGAGIALGVTLAWLVGASLWRISRSDPVAVGWRPLITPLILVVPYLIVLESGWEPLYAPLVVLLVGSAWLTVSLLALVLVLLAFRLDERIGDLRALHVPVAISALVGLTVMIGLASFRFWIEHQFGISNAMM